MSCLLVNALLLSTESKEVPVTLQVDVSLSLCNAGGLHFISPSHVMLADILSATEKSRISCNLL